MFKFTCFCGCYFLKREIMKNKIFTPKIYAYIRHSMIYKFMIKCFPLSYILRLQLKFDTFNSHLSRTMHKYHIDCLLCAQLQLKKYNEGVYFLLENMETRFAFIFIELSTVKNKCLYDTYACKSS